MKPSRFRFPPPSFRTLHSAFCIRVVLCLLTSVFWCPAATFSGNARLEVADSTGGLSWNSTNNALTIQCWFKISIPTGTNLTENLTILANRRSGSTDNAHAYLIEFDIYTGNIEFSARGSGFRRFTLVERPFLDRWYHVAIVRQAEEFTAFVDGRTVTVPAGAGVGDARSTDGVSIGGWGGSKYLFGEVQEVSIYQSALSQDFIVQNLYANQPAIPELRGYFRLGSSTNLAQSLTNSAPAPVPTGTEGATKQGSGIVEFEEANQAGEQSAFDSRKNGGRDALAPLSGAFTWEQTALARPTPGVAFDFRFGYSSANAFGGFKLGGIDPYAAGPLGKGWRHTFETRVLPAQTFSPLSDTDTLGLMLWNGAIQTWDLDYGLGEYRPRDREYKGELSLTTTNCQWTTPERLVYVFKRPDTGSAVMRGRLLEIRDFNGNKVRVQWDEIRGRITNALDTAGGTYTFDTNSLIKSVTFGPWQVNFAYDNTNNRLISKSITNTVAGLYTNIPTTWQFAYNANGLLDRITDPRGNTNIFVEYDKYGRKTNAVDALGRATRTEYGVLAKRQIRHTDPDNFQWVETYDRKGRILTQQDPLTNVTRYAYDDAGNRISITEPLNWTTLFAYDSRANVIARTNALGEVTRWQFHSFFNKATNEVNPLNWTNRYDLDNTTGNLLRHHDDLGTLVSYTYNTNGLVLTSTDANGHASRFTYNADGFLIARTDPATNTTWFAYNDVGWKLAETNALGQVTTSALDLNGNVVRTVDPLQRVFTKTYDANGNLLSASDGKGQITRFAYDAANQKINMVDRTGTNTWIYTFTRRGKPERTIAPAPYNYTVTNFYDDANRLVRVSDPLGNTSTNVYDANGNLTALIDPLGQRWAKSYDRLNRVTAGTDPLGNAKRTTYDPAGRVKEITSPRGFATTHDYDGRGRLTRWLDAEGYEWRYTYDGNGNIVDIEDALHGHYVMAYGPRNERTLERNQDNFEWRYAYDELLRPKRQTDPNGTVRTVVYDRGGRVDYALLSTGRTDDHQYDANNNLRVLSRSRPGEPPTTTTLAYDILDRLTESTDAHAQTVRFGYDALGRRTTLTYPDGKTLTNGYDPLNRLANQVDWAGRQMAYEYDRAGRLIRRTYPNGVFQVNAFDTANRLTGLSFQATSIPASSNQIAIALTYAYDKNGNKTNSTERGTLDWPMPTLTDETARYTPSGRLLDRSIHPLAPTGGEGQGEGAIRYSYDASGSMTNASGIGQTWSLTYDEDNRTTSINWDCGITSKRIVSRYDALGHRIGKTVDGTQTGYVLDLAGGMERILCDLDASGAITAWYVHGPDLCYKVDTTGTVTCFHADAQANIIALTGANGTNLAQYAYTPYGRSLASTDFQFSAFSFQPFTFVGSQGVMEELPGLFFMRARYYSAEAGVFLSTDPVKHIGPGWKPESYTYGSGNPHRFIDPKGEVIQVLAIVGSVWVAEQTVVRMVNIGLSALEAGTEEFANEGRVSGNTWKAAGQDLLKTAFEEVVPGGSTQLAILEERSGLQMADAVVDDAEDWIPFVPSIKAGKHIGQIYLNLKTGLSKNSAPGDTRAPSAFGRDQPATPMSSSTSRSPFSGQTPAAALFAQQSNARYETPASVASMFSGTCSAGGGSSGGSGGGSSSSSAGGSSGFSRTVQAVTAAANNAVNSATCYGFNCDRTLSGSAVVAV